jgi:glycosyltransferase involved in cell wall biosynthesis
MIVKDEAGVIRRCLDTVRPFIDRWVIVDTGSSDETQALVREALGGVPGELCDRPWKNFAYNRNEALVLARGQADYLLVIDADEQLEAEPGFAMPELVADEYALRCRFRDSPVTWFRTALIRSALPWRYEGVVHEGLVCDAPRRAGRIEGLGIRSFSDGARNSDPAKKYQEDVRLLEAALAEDPDNARNVFYLARSYHDAGDLERAIATYERRAAMGGWGEEVFYSLHQAAALRQNLGRPWPEVMNGYLAAYQARPGRAEPLYEIAAHYRKASEWALAERFARAACLIPRPADVLSVDESVYAWRARDELAVAAFFLGKFSEAFALNQAILAEGRLPDGDRERILNNLRHCAAKLEAGVF